MDIRKGEEQMSVILCVELNSLPPHYLFICYAVEDETDVAQVLFLFNMVRYLGLALCTTYSRVFKY